MKTFLSIWGAISPILVVIISAATFVFNALVYRRKELFSQSRKISVWSTGVIFKPEFRSTFIVRNASTEPVYNVFVFTYFNNDTPSVQEIFDGNLKAEKYQYYEILPPGDTELSLLSGGASVGGGHEVPAMVFTDSSNQPWYRRANGALVREEYIAIARHTGHLLKAVH